MSIDLQHAQANSVEKEEAVQKDPVVNNANDRENQTAGIIDEDNGKKSPRSLQPCERRWLR